MPQTRMNTGETTVLAAVRRDLEALGAVDAALASGALAASALVLAARMDDQSNSATSVSMCARALAETLRELRELAPDVVVEDRLDDLAGRREERRRAVAADG